MNCWIEVDARRLGQRAHAQLGLFHDLEINLRPSISAFTGFQCIGCCRHQNIGNDVSESDRFRFFKSTLGDPGGTHANAGRVKRGSVTRYGISIYDDARQIQYTRGHVTGKRCAIRSGNGSAIQIHKVGVSAAERYRKAPLLQAFRQCFTILYHLVLKNTEPLCLRDFKSEGECGNCIYMRTTLLSRENRSINLASKCIVRRDDHCPPWSIE